MAQARLTAELTARLAHWGAPSAVVATAVDDLLARHTEPHRRYHTLEHVNEAREVARSLGGDDVVDLALWFHDAVYDPRRSDNEARSAELARDVLARVGAPDDVGHEVAWLVELTAEHDAPRDERRAGCVLDADLSILGTPPDRYDRYRRDVRAEYDYLDDATWTAGRRAVLEGFLARDRLYATDAAHERYDAAARANLRAELLTLPAP